MHIQVTRMFSSLGVQPVMNRAGGTGSTLAKKGMLTCARRLEGS